MIGAVVKCQGGKGKVSVVLVVIVCQRRLLKADGWTDGWIDYIKQPKRTRQTQETNAAASPNDMQYVKNK